MASTYTVGQVLMLGVDYEIRTVKGKEILIHLSDRSYDAIKLFHTYLIDSLFR